MRLQNLFRRHQTKVWLLSVVAVGVLILNVGATRNTMPVQYEYKTLWFRMNATDNPNHLQSTFSDVLNQEAASGWEFAGRCAHCSTTESWMDYVVFRRPRR